MMNNRSWSLIVPFCLTLLAFQASASEESVQREGGLVQKSGSYSGSIALVNEQSSVSVESLQQVASLFEKATSCHIFVSDKAGKATITLTIVDKPGDPRMILAPEDHWGRVNVANLVDDLPGANAKKKFLEPRARKLMIKALSILCGGGSSSFKGNVMNAATVRELDMLKEQLPMDMIGHYTTYLPKIGVTQKVVATYLDACCEGWAPAPTNALQKQIMNEVHAPPKNPMKIEFDPKKGR